MNVITIDGITCSGKSLLAELLLKELKKKNKKVTLINKDLFLFTRAKRINATKKVKKNIFHQNQIHYDLKKLSRVIKFLTQPSSLKTLRISKLYNRKNGKNDLSTTFKFRKNNLIIFEGIYVNEDLRKIINPIYKILIIEKVYDSLFRKIERIRDKKISIQNVVKEFTKIHLQSFYRYLIGQSFDITFEFNKTNFLKVNNGKTRQIGYIKNFLKKHSF